MASFVQQLITGVSIGSIYALLAVGYALIYSIFDFTNFAFGSLMMCCAYAAFFTISYFGLPLPVALVLILGCGVPMWPAFGKVDFCRTGADVGLKWIDLPAEKKMHRERVSTVNGVNNTIFRRQLDGRAFVNDPDVVLIRSYNITMSARKRELIARINKIFGNLIFVSDDVDRYNADQWRVYNYVTDGEQITVHEAYYLNKRDIYVRYTEKGEEHTLIFDVQQGEIMKLK